MTRTELRRRYEKTHYALHALWTKAVGTPGYDKKKWQELEKAIDDVAHFGQEAIGDTPGGLLR